VTDESAIEQKDREKPSDGDDGINDGNERRETVCTKGSNNGTELAAADVPVSTDEPYRPQLL
jgi:hypothetical protein